MRKSIFVISLIAVLSIVLALFSGCKKDDNVVLPSDEFAAPSAPKALSDNGSVRLSWTASSSATSSEFSHYRISTWNATQTTLIKTDSTANATATSFTVSGLTNGTKYTFLIQSVKTGGALSQGVSIVWGPAVRYTGAKIYEFNSSNPSGLSFSDGSQKAFTSANKGTIDLWIDGRTGTPTLKSPDNQTISTGWRTTGLAQSVVGGTATLNTYAAYPLASAITSNELTINPSNVYFAKTSDGHFARFTVSAVQGTAPDRYITVDVSYNEGIGEYAKR